jgi:hypothetical protein
MEFFGDREREEDPRAVAGDVEALLARAAAHACGPLRHEALAAALVRAGALAQGLADVDEGGAAARASMRLASRVARALWASWRAGGDAPAPAAPPHGAATLLGVRLPPSVRLRAPEGYRLYALYPECYGAAGAPLAGLRDLTFVGIRSIGTGLAAMAAAGAGSRRVPYTVRPGGHPFSRTVELPPPLAAAARRPGATFAVVDEGPGLSGSSFAAVASAVLRAGVPAERVHLLTGHAWPPGVHASAETRALFERLPRHTVSFDALFLSGGPLAITRLAEDVVGPAEGGVDDVTGGGWRERLFGDERAWPPSAGWLERRKLLFTAGGRRWVARFAGLGGDGERKLERARALAAAGVGIAPAALRHGFLFEPWLGEARPLSTAAVPRAALLDAVTRLVRASAARPRAASDGAPPRALAELARVNAAEALGPEAGDRARLLEAFLPDVEREARPVEVDGKMQPWEWLVLPGGRLVKTDAVDHHAAHDLAGCQDALWDVAGAQVELGLTHREARRLARAARAVSRGADPALLPFYRVAFLALEVGRWTYALASEPPGPERARREAALERYRRALAAELHALARRAQPPSLVRTKAQRKPTTVTSPERSCAVSNASGIMVSASMARIAPAATAVVPAITSGENERKSE